MEPISSRAITITDTVLSDTKPDEIPIEQRNRYELAINLKTAGQLGIKMPRFIEATADETTE